MNRSVCRVMVGVTGLAVAQTAHPAAFTLNDVMQAPFASYLLTAPTGGAVT